MTSKLIFIPCAAILLLGIFLQNSFCSQLPVKHAHPHPFHKEPPSVCPSTNDVYLKELTESLSMRAPAKVPWSEYAGYGSGTSHGQIEETVSLHVPTYCVYDHDQEKNGESLETSDLQLLLDWGRRSERLGFTRNMSVTITLDMEGCELGNHTQVPCFPVSRSKLVISGDTVDHYYQYRLLREQVIWLAFEPPLNIFNLDLNHIDKDESKWERTQLGEVSYERLQSRDATMEQLSAALGDDDKRWIVVGIELTNGSPSYTLTEKSRLS